MGTNYIAPLHEDVERRSVLYRNRYGMDIAADLYLRKDADLSHQDPALIAGAPYGGVKEQGPCVYGSELAQRGFVVLAFDQSFMGQSGGWPRNLSSPDIFTENFSAAVDYLGLQPFVDREKIGVVGICGSGGFALSAAQSDTRIKTVATSSMCDMSAAVRLGMDEDAVRQNKDRISRQRWADAEQGVPEYNPYFPNHPLESVPAELEEPTAEWFRFYALERGFHPRPEGALPPPATWP